jgi:hypothetical protein
VRHNTLPGNVMGLFCDGGIGRQEGRNCPSHNASAGIS